MSATLFPYGPEGRSVPDGYDHPKAADYRAYLDFLEARLSRRDSITWTLEYSPAEIYRVGYGIRVSDMADRLGKSVSSTTTLLRGMRYPSALEVRLLKDLTGGLISDSIWNAWNDSSHSPSAVLSQAQLADVKPRYAKLHRVHLESEDFRRGRPLSNESAADPMKVRSVSLSNSMYEFMKGLAKSDIGPGSISALVREALTPYLVERGYEPPTKLSGPQVERVVQERRKERKVEAATTDTTRELIDTQSLDTTPVESNVDRAPTTITMPAPPIDLFARAREEIAEEVPAPTIFPHSYTHREASPLYKLPQDCEVEYSESGHLVFRKSFTDPGWTQDRNLSPVYILDDGRHITLTSDGVEQMHYADGSVKTSEEVAYGVAHPKKEESVDLTPSPHPQDVLEQQRRLDEEFARIQQNEAASADFDSADPFSEDSLDPSIQDPEYIEILDKARAALLRGDDSYDVLDRLCCAGVELDDIAKLFKSLSMEVPQ